MAQKKEDLIGLDVAALMSRLNEVKARLLVARIAKKQNAIKDTSIFKKDKKEVARILTLINSKQGEEA